MHTMKLLALETASHHLSVALSLDGRILEHAEHVANGGAEHLLPWVRRLLDEAGIRLQQLDGIVYGAGPGAFTGLRLGCGVAQGLACGLDVPLLGVSSLEALAWAAQVRAPWASHILACLDARMQEVYVAAYERDARGGLQEIQAAQVLPAAEVRLPDVSREARWLGCGDGFGVYPALLAAELEQVMADVRPTATALLQLAAPRLAAGEGVDAALARPLYVRNKVALTTAERLARGGSK